MENTDTASETSNSTRRDAEHDRSDNYDSERAPIHDEKSPSAAPTTSTPTFPDGGFVAWMQCAGAFFLFFNSWGLTNAFGVYQEFYESQYILTKSSSDISWIGSIQACLLVLGGQMTGPLLDLGYLRSLIVSGSLLVTFGMMMASISKSYWQLMLSQGVTVGLGYSCLFIPAVAIVPTYFSKKRAFAVGIAASGSSIGGILYAIVFRQLQPSLGFGWATRVIAFITIATQMVPILGMRMRFRPSERRRIYDAAAWKEPPWSMFCGGTFFAFAGMYVPFYYVEIYAVQNRIGTGMINSYLVSLLNAGGFVGRLAPNLVADTVGPLNTLIPCSLVAALLAFAWVAVDSTAGIAIFCILYGFFSGSFVSLHPVVTVSLCPNLSVLGVRMGMTMVPLAIGLLIGNPIAGAILRNTGKGHDSGVEGYVGDYSGLQAFCGATVIASVLFMAAARIAKVGCDLKTKA